MQVLRYPEPTMACFISANVSSLFSADPISLRYTRVYQLLWRAIMGVPTITVRSPPRTVWGPEKSTGNDSYQQISQFTERLTFLRGVNPKRRRTDYVSAFGFMNDEHEVNPQLFAYLYSLTFQLSWRPSSSVISSLNTLLPSTSLA